MRIFLSLIILFIQCIATFVLLFSVYMIFVLIDYDGGIDNFIGTTIIQPLLGGFISFLTIVLCLIVGLPIRIHKSINAWWSKNYLISIFGAFAGLALLAMSLLPYFRDTITAEVNDTEGLRQIPNIVLASTGWILTAFSVVHIFPNDTILLQLQQVVTKFTRTER